MRTKQFVLAVAATSLFLAGSALAGTIRLKMAHVLNEQTAYHKSMEKMKEIMEERSGGRLSARIYPNSQLGNERDLIEGLQMGTVDVAIFTNAPAAAFVPEFDLTSAPFVLKDFDHAFRVSDGPIGDLISKLLLEKQSIRNLGFMDSGMRHMFSNKPIRTLDDLKGLKVRVMENSLHMDTFTALGAIPTPMAMSEVFTALSQGTVDAAENTLQYIYNMKLYEVCKYVTKTGHFYGVVGFGLSEKTYQKLPDDLKKIVLEAGREAAMFERELNNRNNIMAEDELKALGVEIIEIDREKLLEMVQPVIEKNRAVLKPELMEEIRNS